MARRRRRRSRPPARRSGGGGTSKQAKREAAARTRRANERRKTKKRYGIAAALFGAEAAGRFTGKKLAQMQASQQSVTFNVFGKPVDKFVAGGYGLAGIALWGTGNEIADLALAGLGVATVAARRCLDSYGAAGGTIG